MSFFIRKYSLFWSSLSNYCYFSFLTVSVSMAYIFNIFFFTFNFSVFLYWSEFFSSFIAVPLTNKIVMYLKCTVYPVLSKRVKGKPMQISGSYASTSLVLWLTNFCHFSFFELCFLNSVGLPCPAWHVPSYSIVQKVTPDRKPGLS